MSPGHDGAPTPANAGATNRHNLNNVKDIRVGCPAGCGAVHECGVGEPITPASSCPLCSTLGTRELQIMGWRYGGCAHLVGAA